MRERGSGAPGENRTPNLMVRSHALYPIELRAHHGRIASLDYNGNRIVSSNLIVSRVPRRITQELLPGKDLCFEIFRMPRWLRKSAAGRHRIFRCERKSFRPRAKPTCSQAVSIRVSNALRLATNMLLFRQDEVARNGAFGKLLRPEVFRNAPLHSLFEFDRRVHSVGFPALPREILPSPKLRI